MKLNLLFNDRVGIIADISARIAQSGVNIVSMEVIHKNNQADVYLEAEHQNSGEEDIRKILEGIPDLIQIRLLQTLPQEDRERRFRVVLDNISDGVISIDSDGCVTTINKVARDIFDLHGPEVIGQPIRTLKLPDHAIVKCLDGKSFNSLKKHIITDKGRFQCVSIGRPITDSSSRIVGAVEIIKDAREIRMLARTISQPGPITFTDIVGQGPAIREVIAFAERIAATDSIVSIRGESGTGKELLARAIHTSSKRSGPFIPINCAALPESLLESELFGYMGGAFTGARQNGKPGLFELASDGTVFLDEIAEMPPGPQAKILRVIQEKCVRRIGGSGEIPINTRIITATNRNLEQLVKATQFRQDLYYRINVLPIHIPPLQERPDDIPLLVEHFLFQLTATLSRPLQSVTSAAMDKLRRHSWPGNIRELKNVIERAAIVSDAGPIDIQHILFSFELDANGSAMSSARGQEQSKEQTLPAMMKQYEKQLIESHIKTGESIRKTARSLGISHTALLNKLKKHDIKMAI